MLLVARRHSVGQKSDVNISLSDEERLHGCCLTGFIKLGKFASEAFEYRIDTRWKTTVVACFKLRDLRPQPLDASLE